MMRITTCFYLVIVLFLSACTDEKENKNDLIICGDNEIDLQNVKNSDFVDGAGCYFAMDSISLINKEHIFIHNFDHKAAINIGGKNEELKEKESANENIQLFENEMYEISLEFSSIPYSIDYVKFYNAKMTISNKSTGKKHVREIYGECGC